MKTRVTMAVPLLRVGIGSILYSLVGVFVAGAITANPSHADFKKNVLTGRPSKGDAVKDASGGSTFSKEQGKKATYTACGREKYVIKQEKVGNGWGSVDITHTMGSLVKIADCKFPKAKKSKWTPLFQEVRKSFPGIKPDDVIVEVEGTRDWSFDRNMRDEIVERYIVATVYSKALEFDVFCGEQDPSIVCENTQKPREVGNMVFALNDAYHWLKEGFAIKDKDNNYDCQVMGYRAVGVVRYAMKLANALAQKNQWRKDWKFKVRGPAKTIKTEKEFIDLLKGVESDGQRLVATCGGEQDFPDEITVW